MTMSRERLERVAAALRRRGYDTAVAATSAEAKAEALAEAESFSTIGWGGSETLKESGVRAALESCGKEILDHRTDSEIFFLSANAMTEDGIIVNIDGTGNRVAASIYGPKRVVYVVGRNKIVSGGVMEAMRRARNFASPPNCRRLGRATPCVETKLCADCDSPDRICKVTVVFDRPPTRTPTKVILVDEDLGY